MKYVKIEGRRQSKFDLAYKMSNWHCLPWCVMCDAFTYDEMVEHFASFAVEKGISYSR